MTPIRNISQNCWTLLNFISYSGSNGYTNGGSGGYSNGYSNGSSAGYGASTNGYSGGGGYGGGSFGGAGGDKMSNLGAGLKTQHWGELTPIPTCPFIY